MVNFGNKIGEYLVALSQKRNEISILLEEGKDYRNEWEEEVNPERKKQMWVELEIKRKVVRDLRADYDKVVDEYNEYLKESETKRHPYPAPV